MISIHALREEGDANADLFTGGGKISIHALREEGDSTLSLARASLPNFYPRPPRGGRRGSLAFRCGRSRFLSTPSARRATRQHYRPQLQRRISIHALREEGDVRIDGDHAVLRKFLSTPSARRATICTKLFVQHFVISIHALREEGDKVRRAQRNFRRISIHALREEGDFFWYKKDS